jgi:hypothetical protein
MEKIIIESKREGKKNPPEKSGGLICGWVSKYRK